MIVITCNCSYLNSIRAKIIKCGYLYLFLPVHQFTCVRNLVFLSYFLSYFLVFQTNVIFLSLSLSHHALDPLLSKRKNVNISGFISSSVWFWELMEKLLIFRNSKLWRKWKKKKKKKKKNMQMNRDEKTLLIHLSIYLYVCLLVYSYIFVIIYLSYLQILLFLLLHLLNFVIFYYSNIFLWLFTTSSLRVIIIVVVV